MSAFDITTEYTTNDRFCRIRDKVKVLVEHMRRTCRKNPEHVQLFAGDYRFVQGHINARLRKEARAKEKAENEQRRANKVKEKAKVTADRVDALYFDGVPLQPHSYSRPRKVEA